MESSANPELRGWEKVRSTMTEIAKTKAEMSPRCTGSSCLDRADKVLQNVDKLLDLFSQPVRQPSAPEVPLLEWGGTSPVVHKWREQKVLCSEKRSKQLPKSADSWPAGQLRVQRIVTVEPDPWHEEFEDEQRRSAPLLMQLDDERVRSAMAKQDLIVVRSADLESCGGGLDMLRKFNLRLQRDSSAEGQRPSEPGYLRSTAAQTSRQLSTAARRGRSREAAEQTTAGSENVRRTVSRPQSAGVLRSETPSSATQPAQSNPNSPRKKHARPQSADIIRNKLCIREEPLATQTSCLRKSQQVPALVKKMRPCSAGGTSTQQSTREPSPRSLPTSSVPSNVTSSVPSLAPSRSPSPGPSTPTGNVQQSIANDPWALDFQKFSEAVNKRNGQFPQTLGSETTPSSSQRNSPRKLRQSSALPKKLRPSSAGGCRSGSCSREPSPSSILRPSSAGGAAVSWPRSREPSPSSNIPAVPPSILSPLEPPSAFSRAPSPGESVQRPRNLPELEASCLKAATVGSNGSKHDFSRKPPNWATRPPKPPRWVP